MTFTRSLLAIFLTTVAGAAAGAADVRPAQPNVIEVASKIHGVGRFQFADGSFASLPRFSCH